ncbi:MAG TPA: protein kinase [Polyangia bacterium]
MIQQQQTAPGASAAVGPVKLGRYEVVRLIATGGMAEIYLARARGIEGFEKLVVVKRILPQLAQNRAIVQMFLDEARLAATLRHSNIAQVFDIGAEGDEYFLAMEYLDGADVAQLRSALSDAGRALPLEHAVHLVLGVLAGLHYAHEQRDAAGQPLNIVHRDVSPQNVFVTREGEVKLVDFGIAKAARRAAATRHGTLKGKAPYMSPEQARGEPLDRRSDVFSAAILLWELTTGRRLFRGRSELDVLNAIAHGDAPAPSSLVPDYLHDLEHIVMRGLRHDPGERYPTAQEMQVELEAWAREHKLAVSPVALARFMAELLAAHQGSPPPVDTLVDEPEGAQAVEPVRAAPSATIPTDTEPGRAVTTSDLVPRRPRWPWLAAAAGACGLIAGAIGWQRSAPSAGRRDAVAAALPAARTTAVAPAVSLPSARATPVRPAGAVLRSRPPHPSLRAGHAVRPALPPAPASQPVLAAPRRHEHPDSPFPPGED